MPRGTETWNQTGPVESLDEAIHLRVGCASCRSPFDEYRLWARTGDLFSIGFPHNDRPAEPEWKRIGPPPAGVRGPLTGAAAYTFEKFGGRYYYRWRCGGGRRRRCGAKPKIEVSKLVAMTRRLASESSKRPIELWI